jgi:hypothetical protein
MSIRTTTTTTNLKKYTIVINKDVPLVPKSTLSSRTMHPLSFLLKKLEVGESFQWPVEAGGDFNKLRSVAAYWGKKWGRSFTGRQVTATKGRKGLRFWRTA